jgi:predicted nucleic acid-binding protein
MGWVDSLRGNVIGLDTTPLIYFTEENPTYIEVIDPFFKAVGSGELMVITSVVTLLEVLVRPIRDGNLKLAQRYRDFLLNSHSVTTHFLSQEIAEEAARLRAFNNIRTPDSIQMATAIKAGAAFFLTNDIRLPSLPELKVLALDTLNAQSESAQ